MHLKNKTLHYIEFYEQIKKNKADSFSGFVRGGVETKVSREFFKTIHTDVKDENNININIIVHRSSTVILS